MSSRCDWDDGPESLAGDFFGGTVHAARCCLRLLLVLGVLLSLVALGVGQAGRVDRPAEARRTKRVQGPMRVDGVAFGLPTGPDVFLDPEGGRPVGVTLSGRGRIFGGAWAPWRDGRGGTQFVGCLRRWVDGLAVENDLVRLSQPDGAVLDRLPLGTLPHWQGAPCWFPDNTDRVLLAGDDGILYRLDFGAAGAGGFRLRPLPWHSQGPGADISMIHDLAWPGGPHFVGRLLASACVRQTRTSGPKTQGWMTWCLRLGEDYSSVVAARPLVKREDTSSPGVDERYAVLSYDVGSVPLLAWLERARGRSGDAWRLRLAPVEIDPRSGDLCVRAGRASTLADDCAPVAPAFSTDGRRLSYVPATGRPPRIRQLELSKPNSHLDTSGATAALVRPAARAMFTSHHGG